MKYKINKKLTFITIVLLPFMAIMFGVGYFVGILISAFLSGYIKSDHIIDAKLIDYIECEDKNAI